MAHGCRVQGQAIARRGAVESACQLGAKVDIARFITRRIGVGDVGGQHLLALVPKVQGFLAKMKGIVEFVDHGSQSGVFSRIAVYGPERQSKAEKAGCFASISTLGRSSFLL